MQLDQAHGSGVDSQLRDGLATLGLSLTEKQISRLIGYCALLQKWNRVYNLTAIREPSRFVSHHLLDSLAVLPHLEADRIIDVGSGAGLPGIPLAIARPEWTVMLLDSNHKRGAFLRQAVAELGLQNSDVHIARAEDWHPPGRCQVAISRAFSDIGGFVEASRHFLGPEGVFAAMKGVYPHEELAQLPGDVEVASVVPLVVPGLRAARHLALLRLREPLG